ncbi:hypothetical protein HDV00_001899 [Rhizophlyctis rosea]|nr:hypothetical protein HDV00_001899 [Rhizophlyctis rosea]
MVKQQDFKTCNQSGFCRRHRAYADLADITTNHVSPYELVPGSVKVDEHKGLVTADLIDSVSKVPFTFSIAFFEKNTARVQIKEAKPPKPRYHEAAEFAIEKLPYYVPVKDASSTDDEVTVTFGDDKQNRLVLHKKPFQFEFSVNGVPAVSFNERGYLYYEHQRAKEDPPALEKQEAAAEDVPADHEQNLSDHEEEVKRLKEELEKDLWQETFNGKTDTKPHGPTSIGFDVNFPGSQHVYGIPQHAASFSLKATRGKDKTFDEPYRLYNFDVFEYEIDSPMALYGSIPFMLSQKSGLSSAIFWVNSAEMWIDVEKSAGTGTLAKLAKYIPFGTSKHTTSTSTSTHWYAESGELDFFVFLGPTPHEVVDAFTSLTGRPTMPQQFSLAYHQCRWNYLDQQDVAEVDANFDKYDIPYDVIWLDIEHTDGKKYFTWDPVKFATPKDMLKALDVKHRKMVTIIDPHIKKEDGYHIYKEAAGKGLYVKDKDGNDFEGWCWPGNSQWLDYTNPKAREYWANKFNYDQYESAPNLYTWNDMNEPSVFSGPEITMPKDNIHHNGWEHREVHNLYGMLLQRSTFDGHLLRSNNNDRPFILSRAFFAGTQRYGAIWTGDNFAKWDHMAASVPMILSIGLSGVTFAGADVGGFFGNPEPELLVRWYQLGAFQPFFRAHAHIDTKRREPWLFGEPYTGLIRDAIRERYKILPYIYTLAWESYLNGAPIMRPMFWEDIEDEGTFGIDDQFLLGRSILVKGVATQDQTSVDVYLPKSSVWYNYWTHAKVKSGTLKVETPLDTIAVFLRGGSILPRRERVRRSSSLMATDPYTLLVALDAEGKADGHLYADDGHSYAFQNGQYILNEFQFEEGTLSSRPIRIGSIGAGKELSVKESRKIGARVERVVVLGLKAVPKRVKLAGGDKVEFSSEKLVDGGLRVVVKMPEVWVGEKWSLVFE